MSGAKCRVVFFAAIVLSGCAASSVPPPPTDSAAPGPDGGAGDAGPGTSVLQAVASSLSMPQAADQLGLDLDGDGAVDNKLGLLIASMRSAWPELDLQAAVDDELAAGRALLLFDLRAQRLTDSPAQLWLHMGEDVDGNPANNFSGSAVLSIAADSPPNLVLNGSIAAGLLRVQGTLVVPLIVSGSTVALTVQRGQVVARVASSGMTEGIIAGAISEAESTQVLIPFIASKLQTEYTKPGADPKTVQQLKDLFDTDGNGQITALELANNSIVRTLFLAPDVDTDGDGTRDAMSIGFGFTAVPCRIQ